MGFAKSLGTLLEEGQIVLSWNDSNLDDDTDFAASVITKFEHKYRLDLPGDPPPLSLSAALWAAVSFVNACRCLLFREIDAEGIREMLSKAVQTAPDASAHYSVDLTFRLLPDLFQRTKSASRDDPLLEMLMLWANQWPLSSVGIEDVEPVDPTPILEHPGLTQLYIDRILHKKDVSRLSDERVRRGVLAVVGMYEELAPEMVAAIRTAEKKHESA